MASQPVCHHVIVVQHMRQFHHIYHYLSDLDPILLFNFILLINALKIYSYFYSIALHYTVIQTHEYYLVSVLQS